MNDATQSPALPTAPREFVDNGCTCAPDNVLGTDLRPACRNHDWRYCLGGPEELRLDVDRAFYLELLTLGAPTWLAATYFFRVRLWGPFFWNYRTPTRLALFRLNPPPTVRQWFALIVRRYFQLPDSSHIERNRRVRDHFCR